MEGFGPVASDRMNQPATFGLQHASHHAAQLRIVFQADVFEHPHRHEDVVRAADITVIILNELDPTLKTLFSRPPAREIDLLAGKC